MHSSCSVDNLDTTFIALKIDLALVTGELPGDGWEALWIPVQEYCLWENCYICDNNKAANCEMHLFIVALVQFAVKTSWTQQVWKKQWMIITVLKVYI